MSVNFLLSVVPVLQMGWIMVDRNDGGERLLFNFADSAAAKQWQAVNDGVMGGRSDGRLKITEDQTMQFYGAISLENNGGFASIRSVSKPLELKADDTIVVRVRGDGREYLLNLYVPTRQIASSYRASIPTTKDEWTEVAVPVKSFYATSFGRKMPDAGPVKAGEVNALGFMLSDKTPGPFRLEIEWIKIQSPQKLVE